MSMKLMVRVLEEADLSRPQQSILLAMAESANDDGTRCFPSIDKIAWRAGYKPRNVVDIVRDLRALGVLEVVAESTAQRPTEYAIHLDKCPKKMTFEAWQEANGRHVERAKRPSISTSDCTPLARENAPVQSDEGCNLTTRGVHSHGSGVQSQRITPELARENAPDPVLDPVQDPVQGPSPFEGNDEKPKPKRATQVPEDFTLSDRLIAWGETEGFSVAAMVGQIPQFVDHWTSKGETRKDWDATFRTWMRNARQWGRLTPSNVTRIEAPSRRPTNGYVNGFDEVLAELDNHHPERDDTIETHGRMVS